MGSHFGTTLSFSRLDGVFLRHTVKYICYINPEIVFRRALVLANSRDDVTIDNILSHPVGPIPVSMKMVQ
jgi:hypothetical protein